jgi:ABC-type glycerol-3-phosphate transport system substrate-binding protein
MTVRFALWLIAAAMISSCVAAPPPVDSTDVIEALPTPTESLLSAPQPEALETETPQVLSLVVWVPDRIAPVEDDLITEVLVGQIEAHNAAQAGISVSIRRKRAQDIGGIMSTLRTASSVAPGALPDITLLRREELITASQNRLVQVVDDMIAPRVVSDLYPAAIKLGISGGEMYGITYLLDAQILAYQALEGSRPDWSFDGTLTRGQQIAFPAARNNGISDTFLLQYLAASDQLDRDYADIDVIPSVLENLLRFYEAMAVEGLLSADLAEISASTDYQLDLVSTALDAGVVSTSTYLRLKRDNPDLEAGFIPSQSGEPLTVVNGWVWVIVTQNIERQQAAAEFIDWMMQPARQVALAEAVGILPSQRSALRQSTLDIMDNNQLNDMLNAAIVPSQASAANEILLALQSALISVISGDSTAEEAAARVTTQFQGSLSD